ncbi:MAG TPA: hypothetical protein VFX92_06235 [Candidatus Krumholzibacteria bacterium]|nr:hypothetical protein [Candidatus Krumholzibacteria bacterium]
MKRSTLNLWIGAAAIALAATAGTIATAQAHDNDFAVSGRAGVRVWVDGGDVFSSYRDVSIYLRSDNDCYATLLLVDTAGYVHVLYPSSPYDRAWLHGGRTYRYAACDLGLDRLDGVGIAHLFAVGSPVPFDYSCYGASVFVGGFGYRIYGDPYVACHDFYLSLLPASCRWDYVGVGFARFYVHEWVRYPSYLCRAGVGVHVRIGDHCRECNAVYASYRSNAASPYEVLRPVKFKQTYPDRGGVASVGRVEAVPVRTARESTGVKAAKQRATVSRATGAAIKTREPRPLATTERVRVVSTSRQGADNKAAVKSTARVATRPAPVAKAAPEKVVSARSSSVKSASAAKKGAQKTAANNKASGKRVGKAQ